MTRHGRRHAALRHPGRAVPRRPGRGARRARPGRGRRRPGRRAPRTSRADASTTSATLDDDGLADAPRSRCSRSARRRGAADQRTLILDRVRAGELAVLAIHSATDSCYGWDEYGWLVGARFDGHPWTQTVDARGRRARASRDASPRRDAGAGTTRCTSSAICAPTRACCCASRRPQLDLDASGAKRPAFGFPLSWCFAEGAGRTFSTSLGHFPGAWESPAYLRHLAGGLAWALGEGA